MPPFVKNIGLIIFVSLALSSCGGDTDPMVQDISSLPPAPIADIARADKAEVASKERQEIRLGILLPLSGADAALGEALLNAAALSIFDSQDNRLVLLPHDTQGTPEGAVQAMTALMSQAPDLIIGPLFSHSITAIKPLAKQLGVNVIGFSSDHTVAGDGIFLMNFQIEEQIERVIRYASEQGYASYSALIPETAYGTRALEVFSKTVTELNRSLTSVEFYPADSSKLVDPVKNIARYEERRKRYSREVRFLKTLGEKDDFAQEMLAEIKNIETLGKVDFDAILLPEGGTMLTTLAAWVSYYEIDPTEIKILGTGLWEDKMLFLEPQLYGGWFSAPDNTASQRFLDRYKAMNDQDAPRITTLAYDAVSLAATLVRHAKIPDFSVEEITNDNGFMGIEGLFRFSPQGIIERGLAIYEVGPDSFTVIDPAPKNFMAGDKQKLLQFNDRESASEDHSAAASLDQLPLNDGRPFPYNPVLKDAAGKTDQ